MLGETLVEDRVAVRFGRTVFQRSKVGWREEMRAVEECFGALS